MEEDFNAASKIHASADNIASMREAEVLYRKVLKSHATHADACHQLGALLVQIHNLESDIVYLSLEEPRQLLMRAISLFPSRANFRHSLGVLYLASDQLPEAIGAFERAIEKDPSSVKFLLSLARACSKAGRFSRAAECFSAAVIQDPQHKTAHYELGNSFRAIKGRSKESFAAYQQHLNLFPDDEKARFWMGVVSGESQISMPANLIAGLFDSYADHFDEHLVSKLEYKTPEALFNLIMKSRGSHDVKFIRTVDLGCGTGLMAPLLRDHVEWLEGVDLSEGMVNKARDRDLYDKLCVDDLVSHLKQAAAGVEGFYDLLISADTLVYLGDLAPVFLAANEVSTSGALFAFSVESLEAIGGGNGYRITSSGRFAHSASYIRDLALQFGWEIIAIEERVLRKNAGSNVVGWLVLIRSIREPSCSYKA